MKDESTRHVLVQTVTRSLAAIFLALCILEIGAPNIIANAAYQNTVIVGLSATEPIPSPATVKAKVTITLTAKVENPPPATVQFGTMNCSNTAVWQWFTRQPRISHDNGKTFTFVKGLFKGFTVDVTTKQRERRDGSVAKLDITLDQAGLWEIPVVAKVNYGTEPPNPNCPFVWLGATTQFVYVRVNGEKAPPFTIETRPNSAVAVNDVYRAQASPAEVLKNWNARFTAPTDIDPQSVHWFANGKEFSTGSPSPGVPQTTLGRFEITYSGKKKNGAVVKKSDSQMLAVGEVAVIGFRIASGGPYTRDGFWPKPPKNAVTVTATVIETPNSVIKTNGLKLFQWGFIQGVKKVSTTKWVPTGIAYNGAASVTYSDYLFETTPAGLVNDSSSRGVRQQLWRGSLAFGQQNKQSDTPMIPFGRKQNYGGPVVTYDLTKASPANDKRTFFDWPTAWNLQTFQYTPVEQGGWELDWNTGGKANAWTAVSTAIQDKPSVKPPDVSPEASEPVGLRDLEFSLTVVTKNAPAQP